MQKLYAGAAVLTLAALVGGTVLWINIGQSNDPYAQCRGGQVAGGDIGGPFTLVDQTGTTVTDKEVIAKPSLVYFGYTFCPDVCPLDNARNAEAVDILEEMGLDVTPVFISIDPKRDTPEVIKAASLAYKTYYKAQEATDDYYLVDHSTFTYLMMPETGFVDFFKRDVSPDQMAERVACFLNSD
jgi:protein SCO1